MLPLVCLDVDGTMVGSSGEPSAALWAAAERARDRGQHLSVCTARLAAGPTRSWAERLDADGWHIFHTGAALWRPSTGELQTQALDQEAVQHCVAIGRERGWVVEVYTWGDYAVESDQPLAVAHADLLGLRYDRHHRPPSSLDGEVVRVQFVVPVEEMAAALAVAPPGVRASGATSPIMSGAAFVSLTVADVSKASAVATVAAGLGTTLDHVMMVGDGHNDLPVLAVVGHPVAVGDAPADVRAAAGIVVAGVDQDGAAEAVDRSADLD